MLCGDEVLTDYRHDKFGDPITAGDGVRYSDNVRRVNPDMVRDRGMGYVLSVHDDCIRVGWENGRVDNVYHSRRLVVVPKPYGDQIPYFRDAI